MKKKLTLVLSAIMLALSFSINVSAHPDDPDLPVIYSRIAKEQTSATKEVSNKYVKPHTLQRSSIPDDPDLPV